MDIVDELKERIDNVAYSYDSRGFLPTLAKAVDEITRLCTECDHLQEQVILWQTECRALEDKLKAATEWRPIEEADKTQRYLVRNGKEHMAVGEWTEVEEPFQFVGWFPLQDATHFLPLPSAPTEKAE